MRIGFGERCEVEVTAFREWPRSLSELIGWFLGALHKMTIGKVPKMQERRTSLLQTKLIVFFEKFQAMSRERHSGLKSDTLLSEHKISICEKNINGISSALAANVN